jgi:putative transposase
MESVFAALKVEHVHQARYRTRDEARAALFDYLEVFYNRQRLHSGLGYRTPTEARTAMSEVRIRMAA